MKPTESNELATVPDRALATQDQSIGQMLQAFLQSPEGLKNVEVAERMFALLERSEARKAEREFAAAFCALQADLPKFSVSTGVPDKQGRDKYLFLPYEEMMGDQVHWLRSTINEIQNGGLRRFVDATVYYGDDEAKVVETVKINFLDGRNPEF